MNKKQIITVFGLLFFIMLIAHLFANDVKKDKEHNLKMLYQELDNQYAVLVHQSNNLTHNFTSLQRTEELLEQNLFKNDVLAANYNRLEIKYNRLLNAYEKINIKQKLKKPYHLITRTEDEEFFYFVYNNKDNSLECCRNLIGKKIIELPMGNSAAEKEIRNHFNVHDTEDETWFNTETFSDTILVKQGCIHYSNFNNTTFDNWQKISENDKEIEINGKTYNKISFSNIKETNFGTAKVNFETENYITYWKRGKLGGSHITFSKRDGKPIDNSIFKKDAESDYNLLQILCDYMNEINDGKLMYRKDNKIYSNFKNNEKIETNFSKLMPKNNSPVLGNDILYLIYEPDEIENITIGIAIPFFEIKPYIKDEFAYLFDNKESNRN